MPNTVKAIPDGYPTLTPYLIVDGAEKAIAFYKKILGATERMRLPMNDRIAHAELQIGTSVVMLADECVERGARSPQAVGGCPIRLMLYVENCDKTIEQAVAAGAQIVDPPENKFYGDRSGSIKDPFGYTWYLSTHVEDVSPDEMRKRMAALSPA
jgi:PhnB protein